MSYLSGQDRLETDGELTFRPNNDSELFLRCHVANMWAEKEGVDKHFDLGLNWGVRFLWDTGLKWDTVGNIDGFVFYDVNGDGVMQANEKGVAGVMIAGPTDKRAKTNDSGYYKLPHISGRTAYVELDLSTIPQKYNPTTNVTQKCDIVYGKTGRLNFGIATTSSIEGLVFNDKNKNGKYDAGEPLVEGVIIMLDKEEKIVSNLMGAYRFRNLTPGEHAIGIDLKSIPVKFVPRVPISKKISLEEGATFSYSIPLEETK
ncbi:MAG: SdrD B-like domain-containing protein [Candidatus Omnitrophota bacterium]